MIPDKICLRGLALIALLGAAPLQAGSIDPAKPPQPERVQAVHEAEQDVDRAWEVYHRAALGGTVASPALQADIEEHLHKARSLITQAHEAAAQGDSRAVNRLVSQVKAHTSKAIEESKEQKK
ncbi:MAG: hypothetical protein ITD36_00950 [Nitrospira sp.]|jgi:hypothetical protein|nr:hypothetical protein [Nitrospira sp.]MBP0122226.1 hypothetical protein [Nitrospira sp.]MBP0124033.1 hypothetical protein [Nitrospira sp.]MBP0127253.1 hypothetical protein [Nitrospira sp.]MBP0130183.1 hypothetical protein [Nitrospira sp.]